MLDLKFACNRQFSSFENPQSQNEALQQLLGRTQKWLRIVNVNLDKQI